MLQEKKEGVPASLSRIFSIAYSEGTSFLQSSSIISVLVKQSGLYVRGLGSSPTDSIQVHMYAALSCSIPLKDICLMLYLWYAFLVFLFVYLGVTDAAVLSSYVAMQAYISKCPISKT